MARRKEGRHPRIEGEAMTEDERRLAVDLCKSDRDEAACLRTALATAEVALATAHDEAIDKAAERIRRFSEGGKFTDAREAALCNHLSTVILALKVKP
jgi:hypothetical protein